MIKNEILKPSPYFFSSQSPKFSIKKSLDSNPSLIDKMVINDRNFIENSSDNLLNGPKSM